MSTEERQKADWAMAALFFGRCWSLLAQSGHCAPKCSSNDHHFIVQSGGIVFHSVLVGINYGVTENDKTSVALMIALIFHQVSWALLGLSKLCLLGQYTMGNTPWQLNVLHGRGLMASPSALHLSMQASAASSTLSSAPSLC